MSTTYIVFIGLIIFVAFLLIVVIMVQNPKGGGLASTFGGGGNQQIGGVQNTTDFLDKSTWALATILLVLILMTNFTIPTGASSGKSKVSGDIPETTVPATTPPADDSSTTPIE